MIVREGMWLTIGGVALLASWLPARRAAGTSPMLRGQ
jgi:ABC-type lipoprotein release transport system permease subunit